MITKLKRTPGIYLVGFMACGKSTVGRHLAERLGWSFADIDDDIECRQQISIPEIFEGLGEPVFREIETEALKDRIHQVERGVPFVIALGGGAFAQERNYELIRENGVSVWLDCPLEVVRERVAQATHRPLARDAERFEALYHARRASYARADFRVEIGCDDPLVAVDAILTLPVF